MDPLLLIYLLGPPLVSTAISLPLWFFGRRRIHRFTWEFLILGLPHITWWACILLLPRGMPLLIELILLSLIPPVIVTIRILIGSMRHERVLAAGGLVGACVLAASLGMLYPTRIVC